jgi:DNA repair protein RadA/Sms
VKHDHTLLLLLPAVLPCQVGHVTKAGAVAGPKHLEHMVDVVLYLQGAAGAGGGGARQGGLRLLRAAKNRHGRVGECSA